MMKNAWKVLAFTAAAATLIPFVHKKDEEADQETFQALLWKVVNRPDPEAENKRKLEITIGFNNPFENPEKALFDEDENLIAASDIPEETTAPEVPDASVPPVPPVQTEDTPTA